MRYASSQFLLSDLTRICDSYLASRLNFRNAIEFLRQATINRF